MTAIMTYPSLLEQLLEWSERNSDSDLEAQLPSIVAQAEVILARELKTIFFQQFVTSNFIQGQEYIAKPARWRETISLTYGVGTDSDEHTTIYPRSYQYCRRYWPKAATQGTPRYYADYGPDHFLIVGTPDDAYPYELAYYERLMPLSTTNTTNKLTEMAPDLLLKGCLKELSIYAKNPDMIKMYGAEYDRALMSTKGEDVSRGTDASQNTKEGT